MKFSSFQDVRDQIAETIEAIKSRDLTGDQAKSIQGLLTLATETLVKEDAINRAVLANSNPSPGVRSETTTPSPSALPPGSFILNLNLSDQAHQTIPHYSSHSPSQAPLEIVEHMPEEPLEDTGAALAQKRANARSKTEDLRRRLLERRSS